MSVSFKCVHFPKDVILHAIFFYLRYGVSHRDLEEIMAERGVTVDHATLSRWVERYAGQVAEDARRRKRPTDRSWRMRHISATVKSPRATSDTAPARSSPGSDPVPPSRRGCAERPRDWRRSGPQPSGQR